MSGGRGRRRKFGDNGFAEWGGYMNAKKTKLEEQFSTDASKEFDESNNGIFHNVAIFVNGYTEPSADELKRIMMVHGGTFHTYLSHKTTHIIAKNLPDTKVKLLKGNEPICEARWITDSLKAGKLLDFRHYLLYSAQSSSQPKLTFQAVNKNTIFPSTSGLTLNDETNKTSHQIPSRTLDAKDERFLGEFFHNSRLHHISTMGANFKNYVANLRQNSDARKLPGKTKLLTVQSEKCDDFEAPSSKVIMHIDMDCFFVSVGLRKFPDLRGKPVAVAHAKGEGSRKSNAEVLRKEAEFYDSRHQLNPSRKSSLHKSADIAQCGKFSSMSEIASCSYEARKAGVKNGMFLGQALQLCPELKTIPYDFDGYDDVAKTLYDTVAQYTLDIQPVSCDEMLVDLTDLLKDCRIDPIAFAELLRAEIFQSTGCTASVGLGSSLLLARLATRKAKPNGVFYLKSEEAAQFMKSVPVSDLPGVGRMMTRKFQSLRIENCQQLQTFSLDQLISEFGQKTGNSLYNFCRGVDTRSLALDQDRKSVSAEVNYGIRFETEEDAKKFMLQLAQEVHQRMINLGNVRGKSVTLKVMVRAKNASVETAKFMGHGACDSFSRSTNLTLATNDENIIYKESMHLLKQLKADVKDLRGLGIQMSKLETAQHGDKTSILNFVKKIDSENSANSSAPASVEALSLSQLDPEVLNELPDELRQEVLEQCAKNDKDPIRKVEPEPKKRAPDTKKSYDDLSMSQLDPGVMAALPPDILQEVERHFKKKSSPAKTAFDEMKISAIVEASSPTRATKRRGRPPKNSPRFIKKSRPIKVNSPPKAHKQLFQDSPEDDYGVVAELKQAREESRATLDGARTIEQLRPLFKAWIGSTRNPTDDDINTVVNFLRAVVREKDLELVFLAMKSLARLSSNTGNDSWHQCYQKICDQVQDEMRESHGCTIFTNFKF